MTRDTGQASCVSLDNRSGSANEQWFSQQLRTDEVLLRKYINNTQYTNDRAILCIYRVNRTMRGAAVVPQNVDNV